jgi:hypothetical protein
MSVSAYAALVVSLHGASLSQLRATGAQAGLEDLEGHIEDERRRQDRLRERLGIAEQQTQRVQRQMWTWDGLSLALCNGWDPFTARDVPARAGLVDVELRSTGSDGEFALEPWPFATSSVEVRCEGRRLAARYEDEESMQRGLDEAEPVMLEFRLLEP